MYSNQAEAGPIASRDEVDKVNFLNLQCDISTDKSHPKIPLSDSALRERLVDVLVSCNAALHTTKHLTDNYVSFIAVYHGKNDILQRLFRKTFLTQAKQRNVFKN